MWKIPVSNRLMDLQNYPRSRKSKRIQQPEALDSKTCSTFPVMVGSSFVRMSDGLVLPLQLFWIKKCVEVFNWKACPTHCDGRQWAPGRGTGTGTARLRFTCILNTASVHLDGINWTQPTVWLGDKGGLSWDSNPVPGGGRHGRRRGRSGTGTVDPTSSARYTGRIMHNVLYRHKHFRWYTSGIWCLYSCSAVGKHANSMQKITGSKPVCIFFNPDQERYELVYTGMYWYVPVCFSMNGYMQVCTGMC
jgi:hypothetical protein